MRTSLFDRVSYERLAERHASLAGSVEVHRCERLHDLAFAAADDRIELEADVEPHPHGVHLAGHISGEITVACRRCLGPVTLPLDRAIDVVVVGSEAAMQAVPESVEVHHAPELTGRLVDVLEEEVLLALPDYPAHAHGECPAPRLPAGVETLEAPAAEDPDPAAPTQRPFAAALRGMTGTKTDSDD